MRVIRVALAASLLLASTAVRAQDQEQHPPEHLHPANPPAAAAWTWSTDANVFYGYNYQQRKFADFWAWESQNWFMLDGTRAVGKGRLTLDAMISLEPFTIQALGSPQIYQTGESYQGVPLVNYQHPHDLFMGLGATYRIVVAPVTFSFTADLVGAPALGPTAFMHRDSARDNPQVPLAHHYLDSTHITTGVLTAGVEAGPMTFEASVFRGEEPDENRTNIDAPRLDSYSGRVSWRRGPWQAQFSAGHLDKPEWYEPYDVTRLTASIGFSGAVIARPLSATFAWGENRQAVVANGVADAFLLEWDYRAQPSTTIYGRAEVAEKELFGLGLHPAGFTHPHAYAHVDALTTGAVWDLPNVGSLVRGRLGIGADITVYHPSPDLLQYYDGSRSYHVFLRWRPTTSTAHAHVH